MVPRQKFKSSHKNIRVLLTYFRILSILLLVIVNCLFFTKISSVNAGSKFISTAATQTPEPTPTSNPTQPVFPVVTEKTDLEWRAPLYQAPMALSIHDHFYFTRSISVDTTNWPLPDFRYGYVYTIGENAVHTGIDISSPLGKPVLAAAEGKVVFSGYGLSYGGNNQDDPYGIAVMIKHDFSFQGFTIYSIYAHLGQANVEYGEIVKSGEQIGEIGMTGNTSGPHLHFEVRVENEDGIFVQNPELWIVPPLDHGVLAGRIMNGVGALLPTQELKLTSLDTGQKWTILTYASKIQKFDPYYRENFAVGDIPTGEYELSMVYKEKVYTCSITIAPGAVNYVKFLGMSGFSTELPETPDPTEFLK